MNDDLFSRLKAAYYCKDDAIPKGFKTRQEWQTDWKIGRHVATEMLRAGIKEGFISKVELMKDGRRIPFYGAINKKR
jgi:hypothetical protein